MPRLRLAVAVLSALLAVGVADDVGAKPDGKSSLSSGFSSRSSSAPARERERDRDTGQRGSDRSARSGKSDDRRAAADARPARGSRFGSFNPSDTAADTRPARAGRSGNVGSTDTADARPTRGSRFGSFGSRDKETTAPSSPVSRRLTERTARSNALRTLDARQAARRMGQVPPVAAPDGVPPSRRSSSVTAVPPVRQGVLRNGAASIAPALPPLRGGAHDFSGAYATQRTRHAVAAGAAAAGAGAAVAVTSARAAQGTPAGIGPAELATAQVPADNVAASAVPNADVDWFQALAFLALVLLLLALAGLIVHGIWRGIFARRPAP